MKHSPDNATAPVGGFGPHQEPAIVSADEARTIVADDFTCIRCDDLGGWEARGQWVCCPLCRERRGRLARTVLALHIEVARLESTLNARTPAATDVEPRDPEGPLTEREALDWLTFRIGDVAVVTEGQLARALGVDRVEVRRRIDEGAGIDARLRAQAVARARKEVPETPT